MAIADLAAYRTALTSEREPVNINIASTTVVAGRPYDMWVPSAPAGVAPTTAVIPTNTTTGSLGQQDGGSGQLSIIGARMNALNAGTYLICDRLSHQGGLSGTVTTAQSTNLPTSALTRYTSGVGVMIGLTIYSQVGTTGTTVSASYTNTADTAGQVTPLVAFGGTGFREANRMILLPLAAGDVGVKSVQSVTVTATTGTAGNFGVTLFKPLAMIAVESVHGVAPTGFISGGFSGLMPEVVDGACLFPLVLSNSTNAMASGAVLLEEN